MPADMTAALSFKRRPYPASVDRRDVTPAMPSRDESARKNLQLGKDCSIVRKS